MEVLLSQFRTEKNLENVAIDEILSYELTHLVSLGLTARTFKQAKADLQEHLENSVLQLVYHDEEVISFGLYKSVNHKFFDLSFIVHPNYRGKGIGRYLIHAGCEHFSDKEFVTATTQNYAAYLAFKKYFDGDLLVPRFQGSDFLDLDGLAKNLYHELALERKINPLKTGKLNGHYGIGGLYNTNLNANTDFPINTLTGDATLIIGENRWHKS